MRRLLASVAAAILTAGLLGTVVPVAAGVVPPAPADAPSYYPSGPQYDVPVSTLESAGWTRCFQEPYSNRGITSITALQNACDGDYLILTGREIGSSTLNILAAAPRADVFTVTAENEPRLVNGTYWYFTPIEDGDAESMGFSTDATIVQDSCDYDYEEDAPVPGGLCWHISDFDGTPKLDDGFSLDGLNLNRGPFGDGDSYYREAYEITVEDWSFETSIAASGWNLEVQPDSVLIYDECYEPTSGLLPLEGECYLDTDQFLPSAYVLWREVPGKGIIALRHVDNCFPFPAKFDYASYSAPLFTISIASFNECEEGVLDAGSWSYESGGMGYDNQKFGIDQLSAVPDNWFGDVDENVVQHLLLPTSDLLTDSGDTGGVWQTFTFSLEDLDATDPNCGALDLSICPTITSGTRGLIGAPGTSHVANRATYTWLRCTVPGAAAEGPRAPATCRTIRTFKATGAQMAVRPYGVTSRDAKAGYIRLAVKVGTRTYYSGAYSVAP
jgi:hypothetical protein